MASKHSTIWKALKLFLEAYPNLPMVAYGGETFTPPSDGAGYFIVEDVRFDARRVYSGSNEPTWQTGDLMVYVMVPLGFDDVETAKYAGWVADYFAQDAVMSFDDVVLRVSRTPTVSGAGYRDGSYFRVPVIVPWEGWV